MPKISVYLSDDLYDAVRVHSIAVSAVTQEALQAVVAMAANRAWADRARERPVRGAAIDTSALLSDVRDEFGS